jgi:type I site-specific restriction-modification system R (restriction) subunit
MQGLNLPTYSFKLKSVDGRNTIFDDIRRRYVALTPEEWVRQNFIRYLVNEKSYPQALISIEKQFKYNRLVKRSDVLVYNRSGIPVLMIECKAPDIKINQEVFDQIALYNLKFNVPYLVVTNGIQHYCCIYEAGEGKYRFLENIPDYPVLNPED